MRLGYAPDSGGRYAAARVIWLSLHLVSSAIIREPFGYYLDYRQYAVGRGPFALDGPAAFRDPRHSAPQQRLGLDPASCNFSSPATIAALLTSPNNSLAIFWYSRSRFLASPAFFATGHSVRPGFSIFLPCLRVNKLKRRRLKLPAHTARPD